MLKGTSTGPATIDYTPEMPVVRGIEVEHLDEHWAMAWWRELCRKADHDFGFRKTEPATL